MGSGAIFLVDGDGNLTRMSPGAPPNEDHMQDLVARFPELIGDSDGELLLIQREQPITDSTEGAGRWSLDHLFVTRNAVPVLVELKRAVDTRLRREVVGQLLDYAANGVAYWRPGQIAEDFAATCVKTGVEPEETLAAFLGQADPEQFWQQVDANFQAGRIKLVFVADVIPSELARIVEFLNEQMKADVRAVELKWFEGAGKVTTLVPRVIGETQRAAAQKGARAALEPLAPGEWIDRNIGRFGDNAVAGARAYVDWISELGGAAEVAKLQGSIVGIFEGDDGKAIFPLHLWKDGAVVSLSFRYLQSRPGLADEQERRRHYDAFREVVGPLSTAHLWGSPGFKVAILADPAKRAALIPIAKAFIEAAKKA
jgi:hypothetical protein